MYSGTDGGQDQILGMASFIGKLSSRKIVWSLGQCSSISDTCHVIAPKLELQMNQMVKDNSREALSVKLQKL